MDSDMSYIDLASADGKVATLAALRNHNYGPFVPSVPVVEALVRTTQVEVTSPWEREPLQSNAVAGDHRTGRVRVSSESAGIEGN
jgi:hypothetical protein